MKTKIILRIDTGSEFSDTLELDENNSDTEINDSSPAVKIMKPIPNLRQ